MSLDKQPATITALVVDDEPSIRAYLKVILARKQFQTVQAENGVSGLHIAEELGDALDLIVSDVEMPDGDGLTFVGTVRASYPSIPIIVVSAGVLVLRRTQPERSRSFRVPWCPVMPVISIVFCLVLMLALPLMTWLRFFVWLAIGLVIYSMFGRKHSVLR